MTGSTPSTGIAGTTLSQRLPAQRTSDHFDAYVSVHQLGVALQRGREDDELRPSA